MVPTQARAVCVRKLPNPQASIAPEIPRNRSRSPALRLTLT